MTEEAQTEEAVESPLTDTPEVSENPVVADPEAPKEAPAAKEPPRAANMRSTKRFFPNEEK